jgi:hypothetical protein
MAPEEIGLALTPRPGNRYPPPPATGLSRAGGSATRVGKGTRRADRILILSAGIRHIRAAFGSDSKACLRRR